MKEVFLLLCMSILAAGCAKSTPAITDNGLPGQIKVVVFHDANGNDVQDAGEPGLQDKVLLSQDVSCPPTDKSKMQFADTDSNGETLFKDLKPGKYCVAYFGERTMSTKMTLDVYVSSEQEAQSYFGVLEK